MMLGGEERSSKLKYITMRYQRAENEEIKREKDGDNKEEMEN